MQGPPEQVTYVTCSPAPGAPTCHHGRTLAPSAPTRCCLCTAPPHPPPGGLSFWAPGHPRPRLSGCGGTGWGLPPCRPPSGHAAKKGSNRVTEARVAAVAAAGGGGGGARGESLTSSEYLGRGNHNRPQTHSQAKNQRQGQNLKAAREKQDTLCEEIGHINGW